MTYTQALAAIVKYGNHLPHCVRSGMGGAGLRCICGFAKIYHEATMILESQQAQLGPGQGQIAC